MSFKHHHTEIVLGNSRPNAYRFKFPGTRLHGSGDTPPDSKKRTITITHYGTVSDPESYPYNLLRVIKKWQLKNGNWCLEASSEVVIPAEIDGVRICRHNNAEILSRMCLEALEGKPHAPLTSEELEKNQQAVF